MSNHRMCCCVDEPSPDDLGKCCIGEWVLAPPIEVIIEGEPVLLDGGVTNCYEITRGACEAIEGGVFTEGASCNFILAGTNGYVRSCEPIEDGPGPGPGGPGPRPEPPDPSDPNISDCGCPTATGCTNWWLPEHVTAGELDADKRVRVRLVIEIAVRVFGERKLEDGTVLGEYDATYLLSETIDSGTDGTFCSASVLDFAFLTETHGGEEFDISWFGEISWDSTAGFEASFDLFIQSTDSAWASGNGSHSVEFAAASGETIASGVVATAASNAGTDSQSVPVTVDMGDCAVEQEGSWNSVNAEVDAAGFPTTKLRTEVLFLRVTMVVGNVLPCGVLA